MKPSIIHSIVVCLTAFALPFLVASCGQKESLRDAETMETAMMYLNLATLEHTRSGADALPDNEKMWSVRVVVLHEDGTVEHNNFYPLTDAQSSKLIILKVKPNEKKTIFLFANEESVVEVEDANMTDENKTLTKFFDSYPTDASGFADAVNNLYFAPTYKKDNMFTPIPMSSVYEVDALPQGGYDEKTFYVVRAATKFTINFKSWRGEEVTVKNFTIANHADKNFLMAHVGDSEQNKQLFAGKTWIDWLKEVSDASSENDSYDDTEAAGWLKDYALPALANKSLTYTHSKFTVGEAYVDLDNPDNSRPGTADNVPVFYLPESQKLKEGATDGEQEYTMTINIDGVENPFEFKLPNLKALFRNTHVVVNITMYKNLEIEVDVIPYSEVVLKPTFGLDAPEQ